MELNFTSHIGGMLRREEFYSQILLVNNMLNNAHGAHLLYMKNTGDHGKSTPNVIEWFVLCQRVVSTGNTCERAHCLSLHRISLSLRLFTCSRSQEKVTIRKQEIKRIYSVRCNVIGICVYDIGNCTNMDLQCYELLPRSYFSLRKIY